MTLSGSAKKVQDALAAMGYDCAVTELEKSTRTVKEAAEAVGCSEGQIVKSLIFRGKRSKRPILVIASGPNRVREVKIEEQIGEPLGKANADFVREETGFAIGGVAPIGLKRQMITFIDKDLLAYDEVWAAAGTPHAVFQLDPADLPEMTGGKIIDIQ